MNSSPITLEELEKLINTIEKMKPDIHMSQSTLDSITNIDALESLNIKVNNYIPNNQAVIIPKEVNEIRYKII